MGYELSLDLHAGRLEIEAETVDDLERKVRALDVARLESLIAEKRVAATPSPAPAGARAKKAARKAAKKATRKGPRKPAARKPGKKQGRRTPTGAE